MGGCAFLFPGQGAQHPGMGLDLAEHFPECREVLEKAEAFLDLPLGEIMFSGTQELLNEDFIAQASVYTVSCMAARALEVRNIRGSVIAPYSSGLYAAAYAAGALGFETGLSLLQKAYQCICTEGAPGGMGVILGLSLPEVQQLCEMVEGAVEVSIHNTHHQVIISGVSSAVDAVLNLASDALSAYRLPVSAPYHCSLLSEADRRLGEVIEDIPISDPHTPVISYIDCRMVNTAFGLSELFQKQLSNPVQWVRVVEELLQRQLTDMVEIGPGCMLNRSVRWIYRRANVLPADTSRALQETIPFLEASDGGDLRRFGMTNAKMT